MKKMISALFILIMILNLSGCESKLTTYTAQGEDYVYSVGETIDILDKKTERVLCSVTITDVIVIKNKPFTEFDFIEFDDDLKPVCIKTPCEAVVQINYKYTTTDSTQVISESNFTVSDSAGNDVVHSPNTTYETSYTSDHSFVVAVQEKGEYINLDFRYHTLQPAVAQIKAYYEDSGEQNKTTSHKGDDSGNVSLSGFQLWIFLVLFNVQAILNIVLIAFFCVSLWKKRHNRKEKMIIKD